MDKYFKLIRPRLKLPVNLQTNETQKLGEKFNMAGIGFGNWVTIEDRANYQKALVMSFYDLNKVLKFKYNIGLGLLTVTFGARGQGGALGHYEPWSKVINITRYTLSRIACPRKSGF